MGGTEQAAIRRGYAEGRFGQIHYRVAGSHGVRSPLLMLHPSPLSGYVFENLMSEMGRDRYVIAPDTPGFGMSDPPAQPPEIADYAATMLEFVAGLGLGIVDVLGYHTGSLTSVEMAQQAPNVVRKIVMISATTFTPEETEKFRAQYKPKTVDERIGGAGLDDAADGPEHLGDREPLERRRRNEARVLVLARHDRQHDARERGMHTRLQHRDPHDHADQQVGSDSCDAGQIDRRQSNQRDRGNGQCGP